MGEGTHFCEPDVWVSTQTFQSECAARHCCGIVIEAIFLGAWSGRREVMLFGFLIEAVRPSIQSTKLRRA